MKLYLEFNDEKSSKFWKLEQDGSSFIVTFGKIGTAGQSQQKNFESPEVAQREAEKLVAAKRKKGYVDGQQPADAPSPEKPPQAKKTQPAAVPKDPEAGPAPLVDDGKPKPWQRQEEEETFFHLEALRAGASKLKQEVPKQKTPAVADERIQRLIKEYECEENPAEAFKEACLVGDFEPAKALYESLIAPLGKQAREDIIAQSVRWLLRNKRFSTGKLDILLWLLSNNLITFDLNIGDDFLPIMQYCWQQIKENPTPEHLEKTIDEKMTSLAEKALPRIALALRETAENIRSGAPFTVKMRGYESSMINPEDFTKDSYGLSLKIGLETLKIEVLGSTLGHHHIIQTGSDEAKGIDSSFGGLYIKKQLMAELENMFAEGVFEGLFQDACFIVETESKDVLFKHIYQPKIVDERKATIETLESGEHWEANAQLLPIAVSALTEGLFIPADESRALNMVNRHLYGPSEVAADAAEKILNNNKKNPIWRYELALYEFANLQFISALFHAEKLLTESNADAAAELIATINKAKQRNRQFEQNVATINAQEEQVDRSKVPFHQGFTQADLFLETDNLMMRAYDNGDLVLRFKIEGEAAYGEALDFVNALLQKGYAYKVRTRNGSNGFAWHVRFLQKPVVIKEMAKTKILGGSLDYPASDAHMFFARAVQYPALHEKVQRYAGLALQKFHWYSDLDAEYNTVPGTFAATALAFCGLEYMPTVYKFAQMVDGDHSYLHLPLPSALFKHYGVIPEITPAVYALCCAAGQSGVKKLPKNLLASPDAVRALNGYLMAQGTDLLYYGLPEMMYTDEKKNLKTLRDYYTAADNADDKNAFALLHNLYLEEAENEGFSAKYPAPLPMVKETGPDAEKDGETHTGGAGASQEEPAIITVEEAAATGMDVDSLQHYDHKIGLYCSPSVHSNLELLDFSRRMWELAGEYNGKRKGPDNQFWLTSGDDQVRFGHWVVDTQKLKESYAMVLFDGKNKPVVLYGVINGIKAMRAFANNVPDTAGEAEEFRKKYLVFDSPAPTTDDETIKAAQMLDDATGAFLYGNFTVAEAQLRQIKPENQAAYVAACIMLVYLALRRGRFTEMAQLCEELARLQPDQKEYWLEKQNLAQIAV